MVLLSHPTGNANAREAAKALNDAALLSEYWTSVYWRREHVVNAVLPPSLSRELGRRAFPQVRPGQVHVHPWEEVARLLAIRFGLSGLVKHEVGRFSVDAIYRSLDRRVATRLKHKPKVSAVYAYEDGAVESFRVAQDLGIKTIYELPIGYWRSWRELTEQETALQPEWAMTLPGNSDSAEKHNRKDEELVRASRILVPSQYVRETLRGAGFLKAQITVVPYGAPTVKIPVERSSRSLGRKLRVIFIGSLGQRKGVSYLLDAIQQLGSSVELTLIGRRVGECRPLDSALKVHRWIPSLSHAEVLQELQHHDVMAFPSLFEGFGLVVLEAMACGVPVIATPNGAAPDIIHDGQDGFIVPIRDSHALAEKLELLSNDRALLAYMSHAARRTAAQHSWQLYRERLAEIVRRTLADDSDNKAGISSPSQLQACNS
jgi:glycosyltransferase involved in cell wall biosynthesis